ncbi:DUF1648 domain-containing protein [Thermus filiformis]|uniref:DUF1648 domain-containing protein n=1 Tax=Thermus filiformis TaxID=276 RepID=A0A0A2WNX8_THEFI|nr:DUF1648 domain-containing protein [Thermus filiformis]KGQ21886.1 hypothetical protein THFILI_04975 [Thermus filiformis]
MKGYWFWLLLPLALAWGVSLWLYPRLPEPLPVHWNLQGEADRYGSRLEALFLLPLVMTFLVPLFGVLPRVDPKRPQGLEGMMVGVAWYFLWLHLSALSIYLGWFQDPVVPILRGMGLFFLLLAYFLPRIPPNYFAGVRTPWTLEDPEVWRRTHRLAGLGFALFGLGFLLLPPRALLPLLLLFIASSLGLVLYSFALWKRRHSGKA